MALLGPLVAVVWKRAAQLQFLRGLFLLGGLALIVMGVQILSRGVPSGAVGLPLPFPALHFAPLPLAGLWSTISGTVLVAAWFAVQGQQRERAMLWALVPMTGAIGFFLMAGGGIVLLLGLEAVSLTSYLGLVTSRRSRKIWNAGWVLMVLSEMGGLLLILAVGLILAGHSGRGPAFSASFSAMARDAAGLGASQKVWIMILVLLAFGVKAGLFPVMIWMPLAEPEAPGPIAGIFSGIFTALAILGILAMKRVVLPPSLTWGVLLLILGTTGALVAALYSLVSRHVKQILAYSTLEILGLVFAALGIWVIAGHADPHSLVATMAWDAAMLLLVMHAGAKFVLFAVTEYTEPWARTLDRLGGLARKMPSLSAAAAVAVATLAAIPPLGGFVGEWLLVESILKPLGASQTDRNVHVLFMFSGIFLAMATALGVATYIRWYGWIFLGPSRNPKEAATPKRSPRMPLVGYFLALLPVLLAGPGVPWLVPWLNAQGQYFFHNSKQYVIAPLFHHPQAVSLLTNIGGTLIKAPGAPGTIFYPQAFLVGDPYVLLMMGIFLAAIVALWRAWMRRHQKVRMVRPWTGGTSEYAAPTSFSAEGFAHPIRLAFQAFYGLQRERWDRAGVRFYRHTVIYRLEQQGYLPLLKAVQWVASKIRRTQSGSTPLYLSYLLVATVLCLGLGLWHPGA